MKQIIKIFSDGTKGETYATNLNGVRLEDIEIESFEIVLMNEPMKQTAIITPVIQNPLQLFIEISKGKDEEN